MFEVNQQNVKEKEEKDFMMKSIKKEIEYSSFKDKKSNTQIKLLRS